MSGDEQGWVCGICGRFSFDGLAHAESCLNHPDRRVILLEQRVAALEKLLAGSRRPG